jgi:glutamate formiminotransferase
VTLLAVPNVSEGRDPERIARFFGAVEESGARVLDIHSDPFHHRSVFTIAGTDEQLVDGLARLAVACREIDLRTHLGTHPRVGALDVCPLVPHAEPMSRAVAVAHRAGREIAARAHLPVYFYGHAAKRGETRSLPELRRGGLDNLIRRAGEGLVPDEGPSIVDSVHGAVIVGARDVLIAFNVWLDAPPNVAKAIASAVRESAGGLPGVRALGMEMGHGKSQVSMNLVDPERTGIEEAFEAVSERAAVAGARATHTEIVGLIPKRLLPNPESKAARLLMKPGRSVESALAGD